MTNPSDSFDVPESELPVYFGPKEGPEYQSHLVWMNEYWFRRAERLTRLSVDLREDYLHLMRRLGHARDLLSGEFYNEALGELDDAIGNTPPAPEPGAFLPPGSVEASGLFRCGKCHTAMFLGPHAWECPKCSPSKSGPLPVDMRLVVNQTIWDLLKEKGMDMSNVVLQQNVPSKSEGS